MPEQLTLDDLRPSTPPASDFTWIKIDLLDTEDGMPPDPDLIESIRRFGIREPLSVERRITGWFLIISGRRRLAAARLLNFEAVPCYVYDEDPDRFVGATLIIAMNALRKSNPVADLRAILELEAQGADEATISKATGLAINTIRKRRKLGGLHPDLLSGLEHGNLTVHTAEAAAGLPERHQESLVGVLQEKGKVTSTDVREVRRVRAAASTESAVLALDPSLFTDPPEPDPPTAPALALVPDTRPPEDVIGDLLIQARTVAESAWPESAGRQQLIARINLAIKQLAKAGKVVAA